MSRAKMSSKYARIASRPSTFSGALGVFWASATSMVAWSAYSAVSAAPSRSENARRSAAPSSVVWVVMEVMGGRSQRPVIAPSIGRQAGIGLSPMLRVRLLGELQAEVDGAAVAQPASRRAWALLAWLALHPGEHARGAVAARFWPDVLDSSARASLRSALWELRRALADDDALTAGRDRIALRCETDLAEFDAHVAAGRLEAAVALHRGALLADLDDNWVLEARDEHAERLGSALARLAAAAATPAGAVGWARR